MVLLFEETVLRSKPIPLLVHMMLGLLIDVEASLRVERTEELLLEMSLEAFRLCKSAWEP